MKLTKDSMELNRDDMVDFARNSGNVFYRKALSEYDTAQEVYELAKAERDAAFHKLAMQIKLADSEEYIRIGLNWDEMNKMDPGQKIAYLISKGKFRLGHTNICKVGDSPNY
jgi:hypothetical protein